MCFHRTYVLVWGTSEDPYKICVAVSFRKHCKSFPFKFTLQNQLLVVVIAYHTYVCILHKMGEYKPHCSPFHAMVLPPSGDILHYIYITYTIHMYYTTL